MSASGNQHPPPFPAVPPSLSAGDHGTQDYYAAHDTPRPAPHSLQEITPYLGLRARLSQVWINKWTVLLFLILVRILFAIGSLHNDLDSAKTEAMSACNGVESMGSAMASMPHYLSKGVNEMAASGIEKAVNGLMSMLLLTITGVEELVVFYINLLTSTYMCLITLAVSGALHVALKVVEDVTDFLNKTLGDIGSGLHKGIDGFQNDLNGLLDGLNSIPQVFGGKGAIPKLNLDSQLDALDTIKLPDTIDQGLDKLNSSIPTFSEVQQFTDNVIRLPFEEVKKLINGSLHAFNFNRSVFPVPQKEKLNFCSDNNGISNFFEDIAKVVITAKKAFIAVLVIAAILIMIPMGYKEARRYRTMQQRTSLVTKENYDPMDVVYLASRPYTSQAGMKLSTPLSSRKKQILVRWVVAYATSTPALLVLSIGITGLLACLCQYILLRAVQHEAPKLANEVGDFVGKVVTTLENSSARWSDDANSLIRTTNTDINKDVFGWVNTTTSTLNRTLNAFADEMTTALNKTFGGTVLQDPINGVFECLIGLKIKGIEKGLTWVQDHAHIDFPLLANNTFSLGAAASIASDDPKKTESFLANPGDAATDKITSVMNKVIARIADAIRLEAIISSFVILLYAIVVFSGVARAIFLLFRRDKLRGEGGATHAGDIPMTDRRLSGAIPPPMYERSAPKIPAAPTTRENPFSDRFAGGHQTHGNDPSSPEYYHEDDEESQDRKLGFAGQRTATMERNQAMRRSEYPSIENEKTGHF